MDVVDFSLSLSLSGIYMHVIIFSKDPPPDHRHHGHHHVKIPKFVVTPHSSDSTCSKLNFLLLSLPFQRHSSYLGSLHQNQSSLAPPEA